MTLRIGIFCLIVLLATGINLTGAAFTFLAPVTTTDSGSLTINNSGLLTLPLAAPITLNGSFSQTGSGTTSLNTFIEVFGTQILFTGPISLAGTSTLDLDNDSGTITLLSAVNGAQNLIFEAGQGSISAASFGSTTPLTSLQVLNSTNFTSSAISAASIDIAGISGLATFNGALTTTGVSGISLSGSAFTLNGNVATSGGGPLSISNAALLTINPALTLSLTGPFTQTGIGTIDIGGALTTSGSAISFSGPIILTGDLALNSANGNINLGSDLDGSYSVTITAGSGDVVVPTAFSTEVALQNFTVVSAHDISLNGVGFGGAIMTGTLSLTASGTISLRNTNYAAHAQYYASGADTDFINPGQVTLITDGGPITFASSEVHLNSGTDLSVQTNGGTFSFASIHGTNFENLTINTGSGLASMGTLPNIGSINTVTVNAGSILLNGPMDLVNASFTSQSSILNASIAFAIDSANTAFFNSISGNVGTLASPILVNTSQQIIAGGTDLAAFDGTSGDNTVQAYSLNPPCVIYFNGVKIKDCTLPPTPPSPSGGGTGAGALGNNTFPPAAEFESSQFNLASDFFFLPYFLDDDYFRSSPEPHSPLHWFLFYRVIH